MSEATAQIALAESIGASTASQLLLAAELCLQQGQPARAEPLARRAAALAPEDARAHRVLSGVLDALGRREEAIEHGLAAVRLRPDGAEIRLHVGAMLTHAGQWRLAVEHLAAYVAVPAPQPAGWQMLSAALHQMGRTERALEAIDRGIEQVPDAAGLRVHRSSLLSARGRYADALEELDRAAACDGADAQVWRARSGIYEVLGEHQRALAGAERAAALAPADSAIAAHLEHLKRLTGALADVHAAEGQDRFWLERATHASRARLPAPGMTRLVAIQARIVLALMLREMRTRFGRTRLGYVWAVLEPVSHIATLGSVFSLFNHSPPPVGDNLFLFYLTGLLPFLLFAHVTQEVMSSVAANAPVLQIPIVKRIDVILSRALLHLFTEIVVGIVVLSAFALFGYQAMPADLLTVADAVVCLWLIATGIGMLNLALCGLLPSWETFFSAVVRLLYFASGIYYSPIAMPATIRALLVWNPVLQCIEWFRCGFYAGYEPHWVDRGLVLLWVMCTLLAGLAAERGLRRQVAVIAC